jgi:hypothetical protein
MDYTVHKFTSHEEADKADREYYRSLTPERRLEILLELVRTYSDASSQGLKRVYRVIKRERS